MPPIRVTQGLQHLQVLGNLQRNYARLFDNQDQLSSGRRVRAPSDDPAAAARILDYARRAADLGTHRSSLAAVRGALDDAAVDLQAIADVYVQARERVVQGLGGTASEADRLTIANEIDHLVTTMLGHANSQIGGRFVFAGSRNGSVPFVRETGADGLERVRYLGDELTNVVDVGPGIAEASNVPGSRIVDVGPRGPTSFVGLTGAQPGAGSDSGVGRARLLVTHLVTGFGAAPGALVDGPSGVRGGASGAVGDTVLGFSHVLDLAVAAGGGGGTVSLNGGPPVSFTTADTDLAVTGPGGEVVHLDLSQVVPGFNGQVPVASYGYLSADGGQTSVPIDFGSTSMRLFSPDGSVTHVNATGITRTGTVDVTYGGTLDVFNALLSIRDLLRTTGTAADVSAALDQARLRLEDLDRAEESVLRTLADAGSRSERLASVDQRLADLEVTVATRRSEIEDADLATLVSALQANETVYQSSLLVAARLGRISLSNFL